jgi:hypothetical protein
MIFFFNYAEKFEFFETKRHVKTPATGEAIGDDDIGPIRGN